MDKKEAEEYLKKLEEFEKTINSEDDEENFDLNFIEEINTLLSKLEGEINKNENIKTESIINNFTLDIKVKKLHPNAVIPSYSKVGDAGMDLTITSEIENTTYSVSYGFGIAIEIPKNYVGLIFPRSSVRNQELVLSNCVGVIDSGYRGELQATFKKTNGLDSLKYKVGERGAQIIILPYPQVKMVESEELTNTERGDGGFGSTGV
jgi:dUTP pyrophosphatase